MTDQQIAELIANELFTNGAGQRADRLVLWVDSQPPRNLGGWGERPMVSIILKALTLARSEGREEGMKETKATRVDHSQYAAPLATAPTDKAGSWQPIETAPKDGTIVLLVRGVLCYGYFFTGNDRSTGWITLKIGRNRDADMTIDGPTHWMPIPALPVVEPLAVPAVPNPSENPRLTTRVRENDDHPSPGDERI